MSKLRQNNPLLYIFVGLPDDTALSRVRDIQSKRVDTTGVGYLSIGERYDKDAFIKTMREIQSRFLTKIYVTSGEIKVVYVVDADGASAIELECVKNDVDAYLHYLYPGGILTDIFLLLDDALELSTATQRGAVIDMLSGLHSDTCMLYMLSNVNSKKLYEPDAQTRILYCIALMGIMKDYVSLQSASQVYKWYNERYFREDCYRYGGRFMTVGYLSIQKPIEIVKKLLLIELLTCRELEAEPECDFVWQAQKLPDDGWRRLKDNIHGLAIDPGLDLNGLDNYTNAQALSKLFGDRLEDFFTLNFKPERPEDSIGAVREFLESRARDPEKGFYYIHAITSPTGGLTKYLTALLADANAALSRLNARDGSWKTERCTPPAGRKLLRLSPRVPEYVYGMAVTYLEPRFERLRPELEISRLSRALEYVNEYHQSLSQIAAKLGGFIDNCKAEVARLQSVSQDLFFKSDNLNGYYIELLREFIKKDTRFDEIYSRMHLTLGEPGLTAYVSELESFIDTVVMRQEPFKRNVISDLEGLYGGGSGREIYSHIWEFIINNRYFNILLKSGGKSLHSEINVFMDASGMMARRADGAVAREKINFFYEDNGESIDVLYHGGAFSGEDLYYEALYHGHGL